MEITVKLIRQINSAKYLSAGDVNNARSTAEEGLRLVSGPFYVVVRDQLHDLIDQKHHPPTGQPVEESEL